LSALKEASPKCLSDLGATSDQQASNELMNSTILYQNGTVPAVNPTTGQVTNGAVPASTQGTTITINLNFGYADPTNVSATNSTNGNYLSINMLAALANQMGVASISTSQYWELLLLHEVGHMLGVPQEGPGSNYNANIFNDCINN